MATHRVSHCTSQMQTLRHPLPVKYLSTMIQQSIHTRLPEKIKWNKCDKCQNAPERPRLKSKCGWQEQMRRHVRELLTWCRTSRLLPLPINTSLLYLLSMPPWYYFCPSNSAACGFSCLIYKRLRVCKGYPIRGALPMQS